MIILNFIRLIHTNLTKYWHKTDLFNVHQKLKCTSQQRNVIVTNWRDGILIQCLGDINQILTTCCLLREGILVIWKEVSKNVLISSIFICDSVYKAIENFTSFVILKYISLVKWKH